MDIDFGKIESPCNSFPKSIDEAMEMLDAVLLWLDENKHPFAAIAVNDAIERLKSTQIR